MKLHCMYTNAVLPWRPAIVLHVVCYVYGSDLCDVCIVSCCYVHSVSKRGGLYEVVDVCIERGV